MVLTVLSVYLTILTVLNVYCTSVLEYSFVPFFLWYMVFLNNIFSYALLEGGLMLALVQMFVLAFSGSIVLDHIQCFFKLY